MGRLVFDPLTPKMTSITTLMELFMKGKTYMPVDQPLSWHTSLGTAP